MGQVTVAERPRERLSAARGFQMRGRLFGWVLTIPVLLVLTAIMGFPFVFLIYLGLTNWAAHLGPWWQADFAGLTNYGEALTDSRLLFAVLRTFLIAGSAVVLEALAGLGLALILAEKMRGHRFFSAVFLLPMMVIPAVTGFIFFMLFQAAGPFNSFLALFFAGATSVSWLTSSNTAIIAVIVADVWQWTPLMFLIFLSGVLAIPPNLSDAAKALGASPWQRFRHVTLPMLRQVIIIALIIRGIEALKIFDAVFLLTKGGPGRSTETISIYLYQVGFREFRGAYATAVSLLILTLVILLAMRATAQLAKLEEAAR